MDKVIVKWHDVKFTSGTFSKEETLSLKMALFESSGYLISRDNVITALAGELNDEGQNRDITLTQAVLSSRFRN